MKTSNKLLVAGAVLLVTAAVVNALTLKNRFDTMIADTPAVLLDFPAAAFTAVELSGTAPRGMGLHVVVKRAERINVRYTDMGYIHIGQDGTTLKVTIDHPKGFTDEIRKKPEIIIECPELIAIAAIGTPLDSLDLPSDAHALTRQVYRTSTVNIQNFREKGFRITAANGMEVRINDSKIDSLIAIVDREGKLEIRQNELAHAALNVGDEGAVTLNQTQIGTMSTNIAEKGQLIVKGIQLITAHGNGEHRNP